MISLVPEENLEPPTTKDDISTVMLGIFTKEQMRPWIEKKNL